MIEKLLLAFKVFLKAFKNPKEAIEFLADKPKEHDTIQDHSHLRLLTLLQNEGRLIDFLKEDISQYSDAQIGAAVRKVHHDCSQSIEEFITLRPIMSQPEGSQVTLSPHYDSNAIKIIGKVGSTAPSQGILRHRGWKAHKHSLPSKIEGKDDSIICAAEVEIT